MSQDGIEIHFDEKRGYLELACEPDSFAAYRNVARDHLKDFPEIPLEKVIEMNILDAATFVARRDAPTRRIGGLISGTKKVIAILLLVLGSVEIFYGVLWGRMRIYAHELPFAQALRLQDLSTEQQQAYNHYIDLFQQQWHIVAFFGLLSVVAALLLLSADRKKA